MTVRKSSVFPATKQDIYRKLQKLKTLQYIAYPFATFEPMNGDEKLVWKAYLRTKPIDMYQFGIMRLRWKSLTRILPAIQIS